jgi:hypothetical protein
MRLVKVLMVLALLLPATQALAVQTVFEKDEMKLQLGYLLQFQGAFTEKEAPKGDTWGKDFFIRRSRIIMAGNVTKDISFFMETDTPNLGKNGDWNASFFVQDAFMSFKIVPEFIIDTGMILVPFTHHFLQGATNLNGLDYHVGLAKYPAGSNKVWRDAGVQFRGYALSNKLHYRVGIFNGVEGVAGQTDANGNPVAALNDSDMPRFTGTVRYNVFGRDDGKGAETGFFLTGMNYLGDKDDDVPILSFGVAGDFQGKAFLDANGKPANYMAFGGDVFCDYPLAKGQELVAQVNAVYYNYGDKAKNTGLGIMSEVGYRYLQFEPVVGFDFFKSDADKSNWQQIQAGFNFWIKAHTANVKAVFTMTKDESKSDDYLKGVVIQTQLLF